jgi:hypothetical protein
MSLPVTTTSLIVVLTSVVKSARKERNKENTVDPPTTAHPAVCSDCNNIDVVLQNHTRVSWRMLPERLPKQ